MSVSKWAYDDRKCDGFPCPGSCDICGIKDEKRCDECVHFIPPETWQVSTYGICARYDCPTTMSHVSCEDFEEIDDV